MKYEIMKSLFSDNPNLHQEIYAYCKSNPEFAEAEREYEEVLGTLRAQLGYERMEQVEDCFFRYMARSVQAYYLFGLGLRQEVLWALGRE